MKEILLGSISWSEKSRLSGRSLLVCDRDLWLQVVDGALGAQEGAQQQQEDPEKKKKREEKVSPWLYNLRTLHYMTKE